MSATDSRVQAVSGDTPPQFTRNFHWMLAFQGIWAALSLFAVIVVSVAGVISSDHFLKSGNIEICLRQMAPFLLLVPATVIIVGSGGIDLSVGGVIALSGVLFAKWLPDGGAFVALCGTLIVALLFGAVNGLLAGSARFPAVLVTLAMSYVTFNLAFVASDGRTIHISNPPAALSPPITPYLLLFPSIAVGAILTYVLPFCRRVESHESLMSRTAFIGLPYLLSASAAGIVGILWATRFRAGVPTSGMGVEVDLLLAVALGGTVLGREVGNLPASLLAAIAVILLQNIMTLTHVPSYTTSLLKGLMLLIFAVLGFLSCRFTEALYKKRTARA